MRTRRRRHPKICPCSPDVGDCPKCKKVLKRGKSRKTRRKLIRSNPTLAATVGLLDIARFAR